MVVIRLLLNFITTMYYNEVCWSREMSRTYRTVGPEDQGGRPLLYPMRSPGATVIIRTVLTVETLHCPWDSGFKDGR